ncbi:hypothetical protein TNCV_1544401 [Trichonephila clavipes]|nr:hypothetical protein TNCV_1544401 [Trichonephila clavipes]
MSHSSCHNRFIEKDTLGDRLISRFGPVNWPPRSCDLTPLDYFLWGYVKSLVYADKPQTLDHLEDIIRRVIADIRPQMLEKVIENWTSRLDYIRASRGSQMPEIIFKIGWKTHRRKFRLCRGWNHPQFQLYYLRRGEISGIEIFLHWIHRTCEQQGSQKKKDSPLVTMEIPLRTAYGQNGRCGMQPKPSSLRAQAHQKAELKLKKTETLEKNSWTLD